jgi:hypothetical protein
MTKPKTPEQILVKAIKDMHPFFLGYLMDRLQKDIKELSNDLPAWASSEEGKKSMFHPNFFVQYINFMNEMFDEMDSSSLKRDRPNGDVEFTPRPKFPYFD